MKRFNKLTERQMTKVDGGLLLGLAIAGATAISIGGGSVAMYIANGYSNDEGKQ